MRRTWTAIGLVVMLASGSAMTAEPAAAAEEPLEAAEPISLTQWGYDQLYADGWSVDWLLNNDVYGPTGDEIGEVEDFIIGADGNILSVVAEVGGFWDIGDSHISVPWDEIEVLDDADSIQIPVTEDNVEDYSLYDYDERLTAEVAATEVEQVDDVEAGRRAWRAKELIGDYAYLEDKLEYGYIDDLIFNRDGNLQAVVVRPDVGYGAGGYYAYPYYGYDYGWRPGDAYHGLPYTEEEAAELEPFEYDELDEDALAES